MLARKALDQVRLGMARDPQPHPPTRPRLRPMRRRRSTRSASPCSSQRRRQQHTREPRAAVPKLPHRRSPDL